MKNSLVNCFAPNVGVNVGSQISLVWEKLKYVINSLLLETKFIAALGEFCFSLD